jgi:hypothetical protein
MTIDVLTVPSPQLESGVMSSEEDTPDVVTVEELKSEDSTIEVTDVENQEGWEDPLRLYLHEIGRVPLLTASDEKTIARKIEIGERADMVKKGLEKNGIGATASETYLEIIRELGKSQEIMLKWLAFTGLVTQQRYGSRGKPRSFPFSCAQASPILISLPATGRPSSARSLWRSIQFNSSNELT